MTRLEPLMEVWITGWRFLYMRLRFLKRRHTSFFYKKPRLEIDAANECIYHGLTGPAPFMASRFGATELQTLRNHHYIHRATGNRLKGWCQLALGGDAFYWRERVRRHMMQLSGFFPPTEEMLEHFCQLYLRDIPQIDLIGIWYRQHEDFLCKHLCPDATLTALKGLDPFFSAQPWTRALENQKLLVVHPFAQSIETQYAKRDKLFSRPDILPDFYLQTLPAVQSIGGNSQGFANWFDAYEAMCRQMEQKDFDIAIIGAGAYGLPLAAHVKRMGKKALHLGGVTQLLFGIKGKRWDEDAHFSSLYNEHWVYPSAAETPAHYKKVEDGCYWGPG